MLCSTSPFEGVLVVSSLDWVASSESGLLPWLRHHVALAAARLARWSTESKLFAGFVYVSPSSNRYRGSASPPHHCLFTSESFWSSLMAVGLIFLACLWVHKTFLLSSNESPSRHRERREDEDKSEDEFLLGYRNKG